MNIRELLPEDWERVFEIYKQGVDSGKATFNTSYPTWEEWNEGHKESCRYVAIKDNEIVGFLAISYVSTRPHYLGIVEVSVYVDEAHQRQGIGKALLETLIQEAPNHEIWCLYSSIMSENEGSIKLHETCGFRTIGYRERIAKDRFGIWRNTTLMEYRF